MDLELKGILDELTLLLQQGREEALREMLADQHPADLAEIIQELEEPDRITVLHLLSDETAAETIAEMDPEEQAAILASLGRQRAGEILDEMSADDVADLVGELTPQAAGDLLGLMDVEDATDVRELLTYRPDSAGGIMTTEYIVVHAHCTAQEAIEEIRRLAPSAETAYYVYVVNAAEQLVGALSLRELIVAAPTARVEQIMRSQVVAVHVEDDQEEAARVVKKYNLLAVPVVDEHDVLLGIITVDDVIDVMEEEATADYYRAAGVSDQEQDLDPESDIGVAIKSRLPWLLGLLFLSLVSGKVIEHFSPLLTTVTALSVFITTMAGGAGNAATQALTVVVRGLATGEVDMSRIWAVVWREARVGMAIGLICGVILGVTASLWHGSPWIGLIVGVAIFINLTLAKSAGSMVPVLLQKVGLDPAVASGPFIATITDTTSMLVYFSIASFVLQFVEL